MKKLSLRKNIFLEVRQPALMRVFFQKQLTNFFPEIKKPQLQSISLDPLRIFDGKDNISSVLKYTLNIQDTNGQLFIRKIYINNHTDQSRLYAYRILKMLYSLGLQRGKYIVPRPLGYFPRWGAMIYENVKGVPLVNLLQNKEETNRTLINGIRRAGYWLTNFQKISSFSLQEVLKKDLIRKYLSQQLKQVKKSYPSFGTKIQKYLFFQPTPKGSKKIVHGDFQATNIILADEQTAVIDFELTHLGDPMLDVANFCVQIDSLGFQYYPERIRQQLKNIFLKSYTDRGGKIRKDVLRMSEKYFYAKTANYFLFFEGLTRFNKNKINYLLKAMEKRV